jgi:hypothetical protein
MHQKNQKIYQQSSANDPKGIPSGAVVGGIFLGNFNMPKQINLAPIAPVREVMEQYKIFPEAKEYLQKQLRNSKRHLALLNYHEQEYKYIISRKAKEEDKWFWLDLVDGIFIDPWRKRHEAIVKRNTFILEDKPKNYLNVERAKSFLITDLLTFKRGVALCPFHNDRHPSLHYYPKTNTVFCFSCNTAGDSIKIYQTLNNCSFVEAVKKLQ